MTPMVRRMVAFAFASASGLLQTHPLGRGTLNNFLHCSSVLSCRRSSFSDVRDRNMSYRDRLRCGVHDCHAEYAVDLFDQMVQSRPVPSIVDFTKLLSAIMKMKRYDVVIFLCKKMELLGVSHNIYSLNVLINCFSHSPQVFLGLSVVGKILKLGYEPNVVTYTTLAHGFCIHGKISAALSLIDQMVEEGYKPNVVTFSTLINGFCLEGRVSEALSLLDQMQKMDCQPDVVTFRIVINGVCKARDYALAMNLLEKMEEMHIEIDIVIYNTIIDYLCKAGHVEGALNLFGKMDSCGIVPDVVTFNSMINGYCKANRVDKGNLGAAQKVFMQMQYKGHRPDLVTYNIVLDGLCKNGKTDMALCLYNKLDKSGIDLHIPLHSCMMHGLCRVGRVDEALILFNKLLDRGVKPDVIMYNIMISGLCGKDLLYEAEKVIGKMKETGCFPDDGTYNALIRGRLRSRFPSMVIELIREMQSNGFSMHASTSNMIRDMVYGDSDENAHKGMVKSKVRESVVCVSFVTRRRSNAIRASKELSETGKGLNMGGGPEAPGGRWWTIKGKLEKHLEITKPDAEEELPSGFPWWINTQLRFA
ncbi:PREDICTED: pentatricopeptide repeat-containing protein At1g62914, mitochondrial-like [Tarenaya hassleriana]|uniref:pentatricopeptide repeat-containing protein At1g62914, mitochondrial-like n=1 Tax=Tarenaya hassleriana TaxID=28532 RepID=UPI0008FD1C10|nr:PREDICTED: pentatricopeptide repeat-containing protein At1g62914, mitochondrial-like [Tarenaya hassleriana]